MGIPEVGEHAVALVLRDVAVKALDHPGGGVVVSGDELDQIFRIELLAERGRFDEIAEGDGQMPAFRVRQRLLVLGDGPLSHCAPPGHAIKTLEHQPGFYCFNLRTFYSTTNA